MQLAAPAHRNALIDRMRGAAALLVVYQHAITITIGGYEIPANGYFGVTMFFAISGFLITLNCLHRWGDLSRIHVLQFYGMRFARIIPLLVLFLSIVIALHYLGVHPFVLPVTDSPWNAAFMALTFRYNYYYLAGHNLGMEWLSMLWSLSIEEVFYISFAILCLVSFREPVIIATMAMLALAGPFLRFNFGNFAVLYLFSGCADVLAIGCLAAVAAYRGLGARIPHSLRYFLRWPGMALILVVYFWAPSTDNYIYGPSIVGLGTAMALFSMATDQSWKRSRFFLVRAPGLALEAAGKASYEIYIFLWIFIMALQAAGLREPLLGVVVLIALVGFGFLLNRLYTEPMNRGIRSFFQKGASAPVAVT